MPTKKRNSGFSLLEIMMVTTIGMVVLAASVPALGGLISSLRLRTSAEGLVNELQLAKFRAISTNSSLTVTLSSQNKTYRLQGDSLKYLGATVAFQGTPPATINFDSRGRLVSGSTATVVLAGSDGRTITITINPSGRISTS